MILLRSLAFNVAFYANIIVWMIAILPTLVLPRAVLMAVVRAWARSNLWLLRVIAGIGVEFRGLENLPAGGALLAAKHQSLWETFALLTVAHDPAFIMKRELRWIPLFGWYTWKAQQVPVDRKGGSAALNAMAARAREAAQSGRQIIIFPEGTRRPVDAPPAYRYGIVHLAATLGVPCVPVALNSGLFWPRRKFLRFPGTILVEIMPALPAETPREDILPALSARIEEATNRLVAEARAARGAALPAAAPLTEA
jgi:1-acyl-sn-glycerol-3-phosphate acyltransferase